MELNSFLNGFECSCQRAHRCDIEYVYIEQSAISRLSELCKDVTYILLVADENTFAAAGEQVRDVLFRKSVREVIFSGKNVLIPNEEAVEAVRASLDGAELIIGVGSGVIQDLCKYVSFFNGLPYMIVATAPSMDGYASDGAAMILNGMKETVKAGLPKAIIADIDVIKNAPMEMIKAGYGDIIGKYSALCDWKLSAEVNGEYFCDRIYSITLSAAEKTVSLSKGLLERNAECVKALMEALVVVGIMMSFAGSSRPASGCEHHLSHFFEITGIVDSAPYYPHGIDVAYSTVICAELRERIQEKPFPKTLHRNSRQEYTAKMAELYKTVASECIALQDRVGSYAANRLAVYIEKENKIKSILADMPSAEKLRGLLKAVGLNMDAFYGLYGTEKIKNAISYAKDLKDRYTVLWLYYDLFGEWTE